MKVIDLTNCYCILLCGYYSILSILAFVVIAISGLNCKVNQLDKQFISGHIMATGQSLQCNVITGHYMPLGGPTGKLVPSTLRWQKTALLGWVTVGGQVNHLGV